MKIIVLASLLLLLIFLPGASARPSWVNAGASVVYDQSFSWNGGSKTTRMAWNISDISDNMAGFRLATYSYNVTNGRVNFFLVEDVWKVNTDTREITESSVGVTGLKNPFWIDSSAGMGSTVDAYFGTTAVIQQAETIQTLGRSISCWKVSLTWPTSTMQRWYDPATGIVLRIDTTRLYNGINMNAREVAVTSNIAMIGTGSTGESKGFSLWPYVGGSAVLAAGTLTATLALLYRRSKRKGLSTVSSLSRSLMV